MDLTKGERTVDGPMAAEDRCTAAEAGTEALARRDTAIPEGRVAGAVLALNLIAINKPSAAEDLVKLAEDPKHVFSFPDSYDVLAGRFLMDRRFSTRAEPVIAQECREALRRIRDSPELTIQIMKRFGP